MAHIVFVAPFLLSTTLRFVKGAAEMPDAVVTLITQEPPEKVPRKIRKHLSAIQTIGRALQAEDLVEAIESLSEHFGPPHRIFGALEQLQVPIAEARQKMGIAGMDVVTAHNFRDKSRMKNLFREAGVPCARHSLIGSSEEAETFVRDVGFPVVVKPPAGAGGKNTFRIETVQQLGEYLQNYRPRPEAPTLFEEFLTGKEHSFDSVWVNGKPTWFSISRYYPTPLEVMENPWIQWCVVLPREVETSEFDDIRDAAVTAVRALGLGTGMTHLEWFRRPSGGLAISEVAARPPGAQFTTLISYAHDLDFYRAWPRLMAFDQFQPPPRKYACGAAFLRGQGEGRVVAIHGLDEVRAKVGSLVVEANIPQVGQPQASGYEGEGYVIVRHPETAVVENALAEVNRNVRVELG